MLARLGAPLEEVMLTQRAVRKVRFDPVDDRIVLRCIELALKAPTGSNGQNWEFVVVKDRDGEGQARPAPTGRAGRSTAGSAGAWRGGDETMTKILDAVEWQVQHFEDIPVLVVACLRGGRVPARAAAPDRGQHVLRLDLPERAEPPARRPGGWARRVVDHPAAAHRPRSPAGPSACP